MNPELLEKIKHYELDETTSKNTIKIFLNKYKNNIKEILDNGNCGLFFEVGNETEFAEQMIKILNDEELQNKFKENMKEKVKEFKKENIITKFCELLESIWE